MSTRTDLSIVILNYNTADWIEKVLRSIQSFPLQKYSTEIIVVDNNSTDHSVEVITSKFPEVKLIQSSENGGFSKGNNLGIKVATGSYIMLLNSDTEWTSQTQLDKALDYLHEHKDVGMLSPKLVLADGSIDLASHRGEPTPWAAFTYFSGLEKLVPNSKLFGRYHQTWKSFDEVHDIDACSAAGIIMPKVAIDKVGLLDERFFMYAEDLDWCKRFRDAGYKIIFFPHSMIIHHKYKSGFEKEEKIDPEEFLQIPGFNKKKTRSSKTKHHFYETMKQYYTKHYQESSPVQTWLIHKGVDLMRLWRER